MILHWLLATIAVLVASALVPGASVTLMGAVIAAVVIGALNLFLRPLLLLISLPATVVTLGLFALVINACLILLAAAIVPGFSIAGFWSALVFALVLTVINWVFYRWSR